MALHGDGKGVNVQSAVNAARNSGWAKTTLAYAASTGDITEVDAQVLRLEGKLKSWNETRGDNDSVKVAFEIVKTPDSTYDTTVSITA